MIHWMLYTMLSMAAADQAPPSAPASNQVHRFYVIDRKSHKPIEGAEITVTYGDTAKIKLVSSPNGIADWPQPRMGWCLTETRKKNIEDRGIYLTITFSPTISADRMADTIWMEKIFGCDMGYRIDHIYFNAGSDSLRHDALLELNKMLRILQDNPTMEIEINGHSDCSGSAAGNMQMSLRRAQKITAYLISKGIAGSRMSVNAYGDTRPVNDCSRDFLKNCTHEKQQENRRVEFKILKL